MRNKIILILSAGLLILMYNIYATSDKPVTARTGAPEENNCSQCHTGHKVNEGTGRLSIKFSNNQEVYEPNQIYDMTVSIAMDSLRVFGFELVALQNSNNKTIGTFILTDTNRTQLLNERVNGENRSYIGHTTIGIAATKVGENTWNFKWKSPSIPVGEITFYAAAIAANGNGNRFSDWVYMSNNSIRENLNAVEINEDVNAELATNWILKNNNLHITYYLKHAGWVNISLIDSRGNTFQNIKNSREDVGYKEEVFVLPPNLSGVFFIKMEKNQQMIVKKIVL